MNDNAYGQLTGEERFRLMIEAMARGDEREADRLEQTCPQLTYRCDDDQFRARMQRIHLYSMYHALEVEGPLAQLRLVRAFAKQARQFARPIDALARVAFLYGRQYGKWESGAIEQIDLPDDKALAAEVKADEGLREQLRELQDCVEECIDELATQLARAMEEALGPDVVAQQEGFARFCRETLGIERAVVMRALGLGSSELLTDAGEGGDGAAVKVTEEWTARWLRRFYAGMAG